MPEILTLGGLAALILALRQAYLVGYSRGLERGRRTNRDAAEVLRVAAYRT